MLKRIMLFSFIAICLVFTGCNRDKKEVESIKGERVVPVEVVKVEAGDISSFISATGTVCPLQEANIGPRISGRIESISADEGDHITGGQILIKLDRKKLTIAKQQAVAALGTARASLQKLLAGTREEEIRRAEAGFAMAEANLRNAELEFERYKKLYEKHTVAKKAYDAVDTQYKVALAGFNEAKERLKMARKGPTKEDIDVAKAQVRQAEVSVRMANHKLEDSVTKAPFSGFVVKKLKNEGEYVTSTPATVVLKLVDINRVRVEVGVPEKEMGKVKKGNGAEVTVDAYPDMSFPGEVTVINPSVEPGSRTFKTKIEILNKGGLLKDGMFARVKIIVEEHEGVNIIPRDAIIEADGHNFVFVVNERVSYKRKITTGISQGDRIEVTNGLNPGENIVTAGQYDLKDGSRVRIVKGGNGL